MSAITRSEKSENQEGYLYLTNINNSPAIPSSFAERTRLSIWQTLSAVLFLKYFFEYSFSIQRDLNQIKLKPLLYFYWAEKRRCVYFSQSPQNIEGMHSCWYRSSTLISALGHFVSPLGSKSAFIDVCFTVFLMCFSCWRLGSQKGRVIWWIRKRKRFWCLTRQH